MRAFHNDVKVQKKYLDRIRAHAKADEFIKGTFWENGKGCAIGCTIHGSNHKDYEKELGIPKWLAQLEDTIFENLPNNESKKWPVSFLEAINIGSNLDEIKAPFMIFIQNKNLEYLDACKFDEVQFPKVKEVIERSKTVIRNVIDLHKTAESAAWSAWSAAESAAESAAWSAWSADRSADRSAAWFAWSADRSASFVEYSKYLLKLIKNCN